MNIFFAPGTYENIQMGIIKGVTIERIDPQDERLRDFLVRFYDEREVFLWALKLTEKSKRNWNEVSKDDYLLFYNQGKFIYSGRVLFKYPFDLDDERQVDEGKRINEIVWDVSEGEGWPLLIFLYDIRDIDLDLDMVNRVTGYRLNYVQGFMRTKQPEKILNLLQGSEVEEWLEHPEEIVLDDLILIHLVSGRNVIISGPPATGKTLLAKRIASKVCGNGAYMLETGNPEWTTYDVVGGRTLFDNKFRPGFLADAVIKCWNRLNDEGKPFFLVIDEVNRANMDRAFGQAFTLLDVDHREEGELVSKDDIGSLGSENINNFIWEDKGLRIPYSFRIIATMNSYDRALLFKLGFALLRRFAVIPMEKIKFEENDDEFIAYAKKLSDNVSDNELKRDIIEKALLLSNEKFNDYALVYRSLHEKMRDLGVEKLEGEITNQLGFSPVKLVEAIRMSLNEYIKDSGVILTVGLSADVIKFLFASYLYLGGRAIKYFRDLLDEAIAAYMLPQLDVLREKIRAENMGLMEKNVVKKIKEASDYLSELGLNKRCIELLNRLLNGEPIP